MMYIDTHTHLYSEEFNEDQNLMIQRAIDAGVELMFVPSIDSQYTQQMYELKDLYPKNIHLMMGLHPCYVKPETYQLELDFVKKQLAEKTFSAVGEIGIDLYWDQSTLEIQKEAFSQQIKWAKEYQLPINIHCRDAFDQVFEVLEMEKGGGLKGIFHCFSGDIEQAQKAISYNLKLGIGGVATFKNGKIDTFLNKIDLQHIVLETDSPYLAPAPYRGKRNESAYIPIIAQKIADIYGITVEKVAQQTSVNALSVYRV